MLFSCPIDVELGLGLKRDSIPQNENGLSPSHSSAGDEEDEDSSGPKLYARAIFPFSGSNDDEVCLQSVHETCMYGYSQGTTNTG